MARLLCLSEESGAKENHDPPVHLSQAEADAGPIQAENPQSDPFLGSDSEADLPVHAQVYRFFVCMEKVFDLFNEPGVDEMGLEIEWIVAELEATQRNMTFEPVYNCEDVF